MPELPDLIYVETQLNQVLPGRRILSVRVGDPVPLRIMFDVKIGDALVGRRILAVERRGHFVRFEFENDFVLVINAMLAGRYALARTDANARDPKSLVLALALDDGTELRYLDTKRMGKVYLAKTNQESEIPSFGSLGVDVMSPQFTRATFASLLKGRRDQVRNFLMDKTALASIGNAYADEILFAAAIHPKTFCYQLSPDDHLRLFEQIPRVLSEATEHIAREHPRLEDKVRDFLKVRGKSGFPCPSCGTKLRSVRVNSADADFCPQCQPAKRALFIDWTKT